MAGCTLSSRRRSRVQSRPLVRRACVYCACGRHHIGAYAVRALDIGVLCPYLCAYLLLSLRSLALGRYIPNSGSQVCGSAMALGSQFPSSHFTSPYVAFLPFFCALPMLVHNLPVTYYGLVSWTRSGCRSVKLACVFPSSTPWFR